MSRHWDLDAEATELYNDGQYLSSYMTFLQAAHEAAALDLTAERLHFMFNALIAGQKGLINSADEMRLMLDIRVLLHERRDEIPDEMAEEHSGYIVTKYFSHLAEYRPERAELEKCMEEMKDLRPADINYHHGSFHRRLGEYPLAIEYAEKAWAAFEGRGEGGRSGGGLHRPSYLLLGFYCQLESGGVAQARQWLDATERELRRDYCMNCQLHLLQAQMHYALATVQPIETLRSLLHEYKDHEARLGRAPETSFVSTRVQLLDPENGDPCSTSHPAWDALAHRRAGDDTGIASLYLRSLLLLDFRLAALRHGVGMDPVDDLYYALPQNISTGRRAAEETMTLRTAPGQRQPPYDSSRDTARQRLDKARAAARWAMRYAEEMDTLLECDFRQRTIQGRIQRLNEIASTLE